MPDIKKITLPNNTTYDLRDSRVDSIISQGTRWVGVTTTAISDGSTTSTIVIDGDSHSAEIGDICSYNNMEFIWNGTKWQEFGSTGSLKALAFKDSASGTVAVPATYTFTGTPVNVSVTGTTAGNVSETKDIVTVSPASSGTATYTPDGDVTVTPTTTSCYVASSSTGGGSVTAGSFTTNTPTSFSVSNETLTITAGSAASCTLPTVVLPSFSSQTVATGITSSSFVGAGVRLVTDSQVLTGASFSGASMTSTGSVTATGSVTTATTENKTVTVS